MGSSHKEINMPKNSVLLSVVIPCYNSPNTLNNQLKKISRYLIKEKINYEIILVNDNPPDQGKNWKFIKRISNNYKNIICLQLSRNVGQQLAVICGIEHSKGKYIVTMDDDDQHNIKYVSDMLKKIKYYDVVIAKLISRKESNVIRLLGTYVVRKISTKIFKLENELYFSSFRLIRGEIARKVTQLKTADPVFGFELLRITSKVCNIEVNHDKRFTKSNYSLTGLLKYFFTLVFGYSNLLPNFCVILSLLFGFLTFGLLISILIQFWNGNINQPGFTTLSVILSGSSSLIFFVLSAIVSSIARINDSVAKDSRYNLSEIYKK